MEVIVHQENINEHKLFVFSSYCPKSGIFHPKLDETIQNRRESSEIGRNQPKSELPKLQGTVLNWRSHPKSDRDVEMFNLINVCKRSFVHALLTMRCC